MNFSVNSKFVILFLPLFLFIPIFIFHIFAFIKMLQFLLSPTQQVKSNKNVGNDTTKTHKYQVQKKQNLNLQSKIHLMKLILD